MAKQKEVLSYLSARALSVVLSGCTLQCLGVDLSYTVVKLKTSLSNAVKRCADLTTGIEDGLGVEAGQNGSYRIKDLPAPLPGSGEPKKVNPNEIFSDLQKSLKKLDEDDSQVRPESTRLLTEKNFKDLHAENPTLKTAELEVLMRMIIE